MKDAIVMLGTTGVNGTDPVNQDICHPDNTPLSSFNKETVSVTSLRCL